MNLIEGNDLIKAALCAAPNEYQMTLVCADWLEENEEIELARFLKLRAAVRLTPAIPPTLLDEITRPQCDLTRKAILSKMAEKHGDKWVLTFPVIEPCIRSFGWMTPEERERKRVLQKKSGKGRRRTQ